MSRHVCDDGDRVQEDVAIMIEGDLPLSPGGARICRGAC